MEKSSLHVAIVQRLCPHYRVSFFKRLNQLEKIDLTVIVNDPKTADWNRNDLGFQLVYLPAWKRDLRYGTKRYHIPLSYPLIKHLWKEKYDVVIVEGVTNIVNNLVIYPVSRLCGSKYIWWGAGRRRFAEKNAVRKLVDPFAHYFITHADANIAYGSVARNYMISVGAAPEKVFIAQNTIDTAPILTQAQEMNAKVAKVRQQLGLNGKKVILYVGVIEKRKKVENLILAYRELIRQMEQPVALVIVGDGPHLARLQKWYENELPLLDVYFLGEIIKGVGSYFAMCDVFVIPSEGGLALNQAMAYGKPIIATSADGTEVDLIQEGENGYMVPEDNIFALANAIFQILQNSVKRREMGELSTRLMKEEFTLDNMVKGFQSAIMLCSVS